MIPSPYFPFPVYTEGPRILPEGLDSDTLSYKVAPYFMSIPSEINRGISQSNIPLYTSFLSTGVEMQEEKH